MKHVLIAAAVAGLATVSIAGTAKAEDLGVTIRTDNGHHYGWRHHHWRGDYARAGGCRVIIKHRINAHGERVTVRRKVCD